MSNSPLSAYLSVQALRVLGCGWIATSILFVGVSALEYDKATIEFERRASNRITAVRNGLEDTVELLEMANRLFAAVEPVSREQFRTFIHPLLEQHPHIWSVTFHRLVANAERPAFEAGMRKQYPDFTITEVSNRK